MAQAALARKVAAPVFPEHVETGTLLKLMPRDSDNFIIVEVLMEFRLVRIFFTVLAFDSAETCTFDIHDQALDRGEGVPKEYFLRAEVATPDEVAEYIEKIRHEINRALVKKQVHHDRFEERVGKRLPIPE